MKGPSYLWGRRNQKSTEGSSLQVCNCPRNSSSGIDYLLDLPVELRGEDVQDITQRLMRRRISTEERNPNYLYEGILEGYGLSHVFVKILRGEFHGVIEAEKKAATYMRHKNIMRLIGYSTNNCDKTTILVFPFAERGTLEENLSGLAFQDRIKVAVGVAQALRYMHTECPRGPVVHGDLLPCNIFLQNDLQPMISGFGRARWLHLREGFLLNNRFLLNDLLYLDLRTLLKSEVCSFGILLLRLFCRSSMPQDDKELIQWARPLILERAFHELVDDNLDADTHGIYKVMCVAAHCTNPNPESRPCMPEVVSILKEEKFCDMQLLMPAGDAESDSA